jgi:hypothetical protein
MFDKPPRCSKLLEQIREDNEMRVAAVFLAGTDDAGVPRVRGFGCMECNYNADLVLHLSSSEVATSDGYRSTLHP